MKNKPIRKILSLIFIFNLIFQQSGFAQMIGQVDIAKYLNQMNSFSVQDKFRPLHLRYFSYDALTNNFEILLDKGDLKDIKDYQLKEQSQELLEYFLIGITLPDENFWVNLRPDSESQIIDRELSQTDVGKILLEADLQLKKDTATFTSPETPEGRAYWNKLYQKAGQLFGTDNVTIPTLTRPWIVPQEVIIRETADSAYVYKATLKVMLEQDHLKNSADYNFKDERLKELNEYSSQLIRENIIPKLTKEVNTSKKYASLRQVFYSLILSRWFKARFSGKSGLYPELINKHNLNGLTSQEPWSKTTYFKEYQKSFQNGEYNIKEAVSTLTGGQVIRSYFSGGIKLTGDLNIPQPGQAASPLGIFSGRHAGFLGIAARGGMVGLAGVPTNGQLLPDLDTKVWQEGFASPAGVKFAHDKILKDKIALAFEEGRAIDLMGVRDMRSDVSVVPKVPNQSFVREAITATDFILLLAEKIVHTTPSEKVKELHAKVTEAYYGYQKASPTELADFLESLKNLLINQTRFIALDFGENGTDPYLFNIGDITSEEHRAIIAHAGTFAYPGSENVVGGPRTIYLTMARINGYNRNLGAEGKEAFQELIAHELTDLVAGKHVNESLPKLTAANLRISEMYKDRVVKVVPGTKRGVTTYDTDKVNMEKYTVTGDLGQQEVFALFGSSKTHPDVPKGSRPINLMVVKADVGSIGGHGSVPSAMLEAVADFWAQAAAEGKILDFFVTRAGDDISITVTHINGKDNPMMHKLAWDAFINATVVSKDLSLYGAGQDLLADSFSGNIKGAGPGVAEMEFIERPSEPIIVLSGDKWAPGGFNEAINWIYADTNSAFVSLKPQQANNVRFGVIDFEANNKRGRWAILDPQKMKGLEISQALKVIAGDQTRYSFTNLTVTNPKAGLEEDIAAVTASRLHNIAGEYTGKDDPMAAFRTQGNYPAEGIITGAFFTGNYKVFGWMMGSHKGFLLPTALPEAKIGVYDGPPLLTAFGFNINNGRLVGFMDLFAANPAVKAIQIEVGKKTAELLASHNFFNQVEGAAPAVELAYQKGLEHTKEKVIPWQDFEDTKSASSPLSNTSLPKAKVAINGFGRIGKLAFKAFLEQEGLNYEIVAVNDIDTIGNLAHLFRHDSTFGPFKGTVEVDGNDLLINGRRIRVYSERDPAKLPWKELGVDIAIESTGRFTKRADASKHLEAGAKRVVISAPGEDADVTVVLGVNEERYDPEKHKIISNASCTTNCLAPVVRVLHQTFGIESGQMQTTHAATNDQNVLDTMHKDPRRARATLGNMIPTTTGAAKVIGTIIPELQGKLDGWAMRVPTANVSAVYLVARLKRDTTVEEVKAALKEAAREGRLSKYLDYTEEELVSSDFLGNPHSAIVDASLTRVVDGKTVAIVAWYDNEWGFSNRLVELVDYIIARETPAASSPLTAAKRKPFVGGNWKMAIGNRDEAYNLLRELAKQIRDAGAVETVIAPSLIHIPIVSAALRQLVREGTVADGVIKIAAQNMYAEEQGAFTGGTSAAQLKEYGVTHVILGHSEVRRNAKQEPTGESNNNVNKKLKSALKYGLTPIVCIGESAAEREQGRTKEVVGTQTKESLAGITASDGVKIIVAYEPVWAIGTEALRPATPAEAQEMHSDIREEILSDMFGKEVAAKMRIIYGGSVKPDNIAELKAQPDIDGALVGGASLKADSFSSIVKVVAGAQASSPASSNSVETPEGVGGIDFRVINMVTQPMGSFSGLNLSLPRLSHLEDINLDEELDSIQKMISAGIMPSGERLKEYVAACYQKGVSGKYIDGIINFLVDICRMQEEEISVTPDDIKALLLVVDSR